MPFLSERKLTLYHLILFSMMQKQSIGSHPQPKRVKSWLGRPVVCTWRAPLKFHLLSPRWPSVPEFQVPPAEIHFARAPGVSLPHSFFPFTAIRPLFWWWSLFLGLLPSKYLISPNLFSTPTLGRLASNEEVFKFVPLFQSPCFQKWKAFRLQSKAFVRERCWGRRRGIFSIAIMGPQGWWGWIFVASYLASGSPSWRATIPDIVQCLCWPSTLVLEICISVPRQ